ncbi:hypothetical protein HMPREF9700_02076 [Bergeyella zoohelcum CCUG 30536]|uniref:Uncharacterized protein n=1 Tax=Bergeyella zoohelcum TaxID=1015 RepID=A0A376C182_9FLAO|nr:hypothetical protein HMPREF9700_02076 [Bergeyella zoohelcum CCUG 30536]SSZ55789.1 Uncharacterised protein [Bergeyella zoohelcum]
MAQKRDILLKIFPKKEIKNDEKEHNFEFSKPHFLKKSSEYEKNRGGVVLSKVSNTEYLEGNHNQLIANYFAHLFYNSYLYGKLDYIKFYEYYSICESSYFIE